MDLAAHFRVIAQNWLRILLISLGIAVLVFAASTVQSKEYQAKAQLEVIPGNAATNGQTLADASTYLAQNYAQYAKTPTVVRNAIKTSGMDLTLQQATNRISASQVGDLGFVEVKATGPSRVDAERLTRFAAASLISTIQGQQTEAKFADLQPIQTARSAAQTQLNAPGLSAADRVGLQGQIDAYNQSETDIRTRKDDNLVTISGAIAGDSPISPMPLRDSILAFVVSLVVVAELTVLVHYTGDRFSRTDDTADVTRITGLPVLAKIPKGSGIELTEAFRVLRTNLMVLEGAGKPRTLAVVSSNQSAGKTFTAVHLAQSAAGLDEKVVIVDADLRKPSVHERLGVPRAPGLSAVLQGNDLATMLRKLPDTPFLRVLASGAPVQDASAVLGARPFRHVLDSLRAVRLVVVDTPPAAMFADAMAVASQCDATIFVLDVKTSRRRQVRQTLEALERAGANLVGVVVNRTVSPRRSSYYYES
jgi:succinoglycan biosynthesis transport protein ExoP